VDSKLAFSLGSGLGQLNVLEIQSSGVVRASSDIGNGVPVRIEPIVSIRTTIFL
jgi:hypothetical protein